jgi:NAD(P)H dehydrogenase (quinone)
MLPIRKPIHHNHQEAIMTKTVVLGASGSQGREIIKALGKAGLTPRAMVRGLDPASATLAPGLDLLIGDLEDREPVFRAVADAEAVVLTIPLTFDAEAMIRMGRNVLAAIRENRVPRLVFNASTVTPRQRSSIPVIAALQALAAEAAAMEADVTIVRPTLYFENLLTPWTLGPLQGNGRLELMLPGEIRIPWLSQRDLGSFIATILPQGNAWHGAFDIGGGQPLTIGDLAEALTITLQRPIAARSISHGEFAGRVSQFIGPVAGGQLADHYAELFAPSGPLASGAMPPVVLSNGVFAFEAFDVWLVREFAPRWSRGQQPHAA